MIEGPEDQSVLDDVGTRAEKKAIEDLVEVRINENDLEKYFLLGSSLTAQEQLEMVNFLVINIEVFAWTSYDMSGVDLNFICHQLNVFPDARRGHSTNTKISASSCRGGGRRGKELARSEGYPGSTLPTVGL